MPLMEPGFAMILAEDSRAHEGWLDALRGPEMTIETWSCDLASGIFSIGDTTRTFHGLTEPSCGLLDIIRGYDADHRKTILNVLEQATAASSSFCYCTTVARGNGRQHLLHCVGTSTIRDGATTGRMQGIFAFARS